MSTESPAFTAVLADLQRSLGGRTAVTACVEQATGLDLPAEPVDERHAFARAFPPALASSPPSSPQNATFVSDSPACRVRTSHFAGEVAGEIAGEVAGEVQTSPPAPSPRLAGQLESLGLPADLVARAGLDDERLHLLRVLDALPPLVRPEPANGRLLVVVGEGAAVSTAAAQLAQLARLPHESVHRVAPRVSTTQEPSGIAPERTLSGPREVAVWAAGLGEQHPPMVVAIEVTPGDGAGLWVQEVTRALDVEEVWAVVDARHKAADSEAFLDDLGRGDGRVRALVVHGAQLTSDPGSTLGLDVPVALLDGRAATTGTWAGVLLDRMAGTS